MRHRGPQYAWLPVVVASILGAVGPCGLDPSDLVSPPTGDPAGEPPAVDPAVDPSPSTPPTEAPVVGAVPGEPLARIAQEVGFATKTLGQLDAALAGGSDVSALLQSVRTHRQRIRQGLAAAQAEFQNVRADIRQKKLPKEILQRQARARQNLETAARTALDVLQNADLAKKDLANRSAAIERIRKALATLKALRFQPDPGTADAAANTWQAGPRKAASLMVFIDQPGVDVAALASTMPTTTTDLQPTIDVQITPEITAKAAELLGNPQALYEFVRNVCEFQPYLGSRKGSGETLRQRSGNDYDLASLLIALLRSSNIPARYASGLVEMPVDQANSWLGVDNGQAASGILSSQGMEGQALYQGGPENVVAVRCRRMWVEAYVPRGRGSPGWVPLDPAFKLHRVQPGIDIPAEMGLNAQAFVDSYFAPSGGVTLPRVQTPLELLRQQITSYLAAPVYRGQTLQSVRRRLAIRSESLGKLPASLPYKVISRDAPYSEIPAGKRYQVRLRLSADSTPLIDQTLNLPQVAGQRVTIGYVGAAPADQATIDSYGGLYQTPPYLVNLKPVVRVAGQDVAVGTGGVGMGRRCGLDISFLPPAGVSNPVPLIHNDLICGAARAIGLAVEGVAEGLIVPPPADDTEGAAQLLHDTAMDYLARCCNASRDLGRLMRSVVATDVAEASVGNVVEVTLDGTGNPLTFAWTGLRVDAGRNVVSSWPVDRFVVGDTEPKDLLILAGAEGSAWGHRIFEDGFSQDSISALKILELAQKSGVTIYKHWNNATLPANTLSPAVQQAIQSAIAAGHVVTFPASEITAGTPAAGQWTGAAWIDMDPNTGAASYLLSGNATAGQTVARWQTEEADLFTGNPAATGVDLVIDTPAADAPDTGALFGRGDDKFITLQYHLVGHYSGGQSPRIPATGNYARTTRWPTTQLDPGYQDLRTWISRWPTWSSLASAQRTVGVVGVAIRRSDGAEATAALPVKPATGTAQQETVKAVITPGDLSGTYAWTSSTGIRVANSSAQTTAIDATTTTASTALGDQSLNVTFTPAGAAACATDGPFRLTIYDVDVKATDGVSAAPKYVGANASQVLKGVVRPSGVQGRFEDWSTASSKITLAYPNFGAFGKQTVTVTGGNNASTAIDAESLKPRFRPDNAMQVHEFKSYLMTVIKIDLVMAGVTEDTEELPGGGVGLNGDDDNNNGTADMNETAAVTGENDLIGIQLTVAPALPAGQLALQIPSGSARVRFWQEPTKGTAVTLPPSWTLPSSAIPLQMYVEGIAISSTAADVQLTASYENAATGVLPGTVFDNLRITVVSVKKNPLGSSTALSTTDVGKVYVPTRYGGDLTISANCRLYYSDGADLDPRVAAQILQGTFEASMVAQGNPCNYTVPVGKPGWYYIKVLASTSAASSRFNENGQSDYRPWNGWWWPWMAEVGPNLWNINGPMDKYDQVYGTTARAYEQAYFSGGEDWFGHCWGLSIAAILIPQPEATTKDGISFTRDDMEGLYTEACDCSPYIDQSLSVSYIPPGPPTSSAGQDVDAYCDDLYRILRISIREDHVPIQSDMRVIDTPPNRVHEVWNQSIYKYYATLREVSGANNERLVEISMEVHSNFGPRPPPSDSTNDRVETFVYQLEFDALGQMIANSSKQNWISASHYPPHDMFRLTGSPFAARNPNITKVRIDGLYQP